MKPNLCRLVAQLATAVLMLGGAVTLAVAGVTVPDSTSADTPPAYNVHNGDISPDGTIPPSDGPIPAIAWKMARDMPVWKTIWLGTYPSADRLRGALGADDCGLPVVPASATPVNMSAMPHCRLGDSATEALARAILRPGRLREIDLVIVTMTELGFAADDDVALEDVYARADMLGYELCPDEAGPQLRLQYLDQPGGELLHVAMYPIAVNGVLRDFTVGREAHGLVLATTSARPNAVIPAATRFVFVRPRR